MQNLAVRRSFANAEAQNVYEWGLWARAELIPTTRKVLRDFQSIAAAEPERDAIITALETILSTAEQWRDRSVGATPEREGHGEILPPDVDFTYDQISDWSKANSGLLDAVRHLGTYCHFRLNQRRRAEGTHAVTGDRRPETPEGLADLKWKNLLLNDLEILLGRTRLQSYPLQLQVEPTNDCNLRCRGCRHGLSKDFSHTELRREFVDILSEAFPFVRSIYTVGTGEPTMSTMLPTLIEEAARAEVTVDVLTNGTLLDRALQPWSLVQRAGISIDGATEETMRALRPVAPLAKALEALVTLREKAPQAVIYVNVTVSRMNYDELPALVEKLADARVDEVFVHSLEAYHPLHDSIQVRASDREEMAGCVEAARLAADRRGVRFVNSLNFDQAACRDDRPKDKDEMFRVLKESPPPVLQIRDLKTIRDALKPAESFTYYPEVLIRAGVHSKVSTSEPANGDLPPGAAAGTIDALIGERVRDARNLNGAEVRTPYCFMPWKLTLVDADGRSRACCHLRGFLGDLDQSRSFQHYWSSPEYVRLRESMFRTEDLPDACKRCQDPDRSAYAEGTIALADMLELPVRQSPSYPVPADVGRLIATRKLAPRPRFETLAGAIEVDPGRFVIAPGAQILVRFRNPRETAGVYYLGKFRFVRGRVLCGIKPLWGNDLWNYVLDPLYTSQLGEWVGLPMPPLPLDFSACDQQECCLFLWAPEDNEGEAELLIREFSGVVTAPAQRPSDSTLQPHRFWSVNATQP